MQSATLMQTLRLLGSITAKEDVAVGTALLGLQIQTVDVEVRSDFHKFLRSASKKCSFPPLPALQMPLD